MHPPKNHRKNDNLFDLSNVGRRSTRTYKERFQTMNSPLLPSKLKFEKDAEIETMNTIEKVEKDLFKIIDDDESNNYSPPKNNGKAAFSYKESKREKHVTSLVKSMQENKQEIKEEEYKEISIEEEIEEFPDLNDVNLEQIFLSDARNSLYPQIDRKSIENTNMLRDSLGLGKKLGPNRVSLNELEGIHFPGKSDRYSFGDALSSQRAMERFLEGELRSSLGNKRKGNFDDG